MAAAAPAQLPGLSASPPLVTTPLPPNCWSTTADSQQDLWCNAYDRCLDLLAEAHTALEQIHARILGYLLLYALDPRGRTWVAEEIIRCGGETPKLHELAQVYQDHFFPAFLQHRKRIPAPSPHPSNPDHDQDSVQFFSAIVPPPTSHQAAKQAALRRDNFRCILTRHNDHLHVQECRQQGLPIPQGPSGITNSAHIFPPFLNDIPALDEPDPNHKREWSGTVWTIMKNFGGLVVLNELDGAQMHRLGNILTLHTAYHGLFDALSLWLEPDPAYNDDIHFIVHSHEPSFLFQGVDRHITFANAEHGTNHELPNPRFLKIHAAACRIAHLSGAAEVMERWDNEDGDSDTRVLASDGGSSSSWLGKHLPVLPRMPLVQV
ncbi:hypothetical protein BKA70DRAFT_1295150 [Coprinopsis sp. MPI-PUGE-AT-0042]|nr:hypothetical protein BKA70DRAFT_1295150 [Coprinopsis sp. MPI-PUGE-AT-0042]